MKRKFRVIRSFNLEALSRNWVININTFHKGEIYTKTQLDKFEKRFLDVSCNNEVDNPKELYWNNLQEISPSPYDDILKKLISDNGKFNIGKCYKHYVIPNTQKECYEFFYKNHKNKGFYRRAKRAEGQEITQEQYKLLMELKNE